MPTRHPGMTELLLNLHSSLLCEVILVKQMGYLLCSRLRSDSFKMVNITVHHIWKDFFCCVFAWDFRCWCESCKSEAQISFKGRVPGSREEPPPGSLGGLARIGLVLAEKLFSSISSLRVLKQQQSYLKDHGGIALSSVFSFLSQGKAHDLRAAHSLLSPRLLWSNGLGGWKYLYLSKIKKPGSIKTSHID